MPACVFSARGSASKVFPGTYQVWPRQFEDRADPRSLTGLQCVVKVQLGRFRSFLGLVQCGCIGCSGILCRCLVCQFVYGVEVEPLCFCQHLIGEILCQLQCLVFVLLPAFAVPIR